MSILTKISIVILVVLVLLACPVFITQATVAPDWRGQCKALQLRLTNLSHEYNLRGQAIKAANQELTSQKRGLIDYKNTSSNTIRQLQDDKVLQERKSADLRASLAKLTIELKRQQGIIINANKRNDAKDELATKQRSKINDLTRENTILGNDLAKKEREVKLAEQAARIYHEKLVENEEKLVELGNKLEIALKSGVSVRPGKDTIRPAVELKGTVLAVEKGIASINIGSAKGVKIGMKLVIYRAKTGRFVGRLRISQVTARQAAGIVVDYRTKALPGDKVTTLEAVTMGGEL